MQLAILNSWMTIAGLTLVFWFCQAVKEEIDVINGV